jgi:hypothetical protein
MSSSLGSTAGREMEAPGTVASPTRSLTHNTANSSSHSERLSLFGRPRAQDPSDSPHPGLLSP